MGTVYLRITDDNGDKHKFTLTHVNYILNSPVNPLSTWVLSKQYSAKTWHWLYKHQDVFSVWHSHFFWDHGRFSKTFTTHSSGLPECLFNSEYSWLDTFATHLKSYYDDTINWAFTSEIKDKSFAYSDNGKATMYACTNEITLDVLVMLTNLVSFF